MPTLRRHPFTRPRLACAAALAALAPLAAPAQAPAQAANPCMGPYAATYRCPDLVMKQPYDVRIDRTTRAGRTLLRAANSIDNVGFGPAELRGRRDGRYSMRARQAIHRRNGLAPKGFVTGARLSFKFIPNQGRYWKFRDAARFELWRLDSNNQRVASVPERVGPKQIYCLRDLRRTRPGLRSSPRREVYPACNRSGATQRVTLGTSVGWSDIYPYTYHEQWIDVTGLRGRFAYVQIADPRNGLHELYEDNNESEVIVRLASGRVRVLGGGDTGGGGGESPY